MQLLSQSLLGPRMGVSSSRKEDDQTQSLQLETVFPRARPRCYGVTEFDRSGLSRCSPGKSYGVLR